ncbi:MAG: hypothetical protein IID28_11040 [Planctomycetes bacterium]|nr:hypothetical protein [Planctomycetota bacterium]
MADTDRRIVVEGVEFAQLVQFPRILRAVTSAFQLPRLLLALLMVAAVMTGGRVWDMLFTATVSPAGLMAEPWTTQDAARGRQVLQAALDRYGIAAEDNPPADAVLSANDVLVQIRSAYSTQRDALLEQVADPEEGVDREQAETALRAGDNRFLDTIDQLDDVRPRGMFEATAHHVTTGFNRLTRGLVSLEIGEFFNGLGDVFVRTPIGAWRNDPLFTVAYGLFFLVLIAIGGGALSRMAAVDMAFGEKIRLQEAIDFALRSWRRLVGSLVLPLLIAGVLSAMLLVGGFFLMLPWLDVLGGLLYGVALLLGFGVVFLLAGYAAGFSLLVPAVACENCDAADAQQRAYAYALSHPLHLLGYGIVAMVGLSVGFVLASLFAVAVLNLTGALVDAATANAAVDVTYGFALFDLAPRRAAAIPLQLHSEWSAGLVMFWQTVVVSLVAAYVFSNYFSASTTVYMLMRRVCDGQELDEIWQEGELPGSTVPDDDGDDGDDGDDDEPAQTSQT